MVCIEPTTLPALGQLWSKYCITPTVLWAGSRRVIPAQPSCRYRLGPRTPFPRHFPREPQSRDGFEVPACGFVEQSVHVCLCLGENPASRCRRGTALPACPRAVPPGRWPGRGVGGGSPRPLITPVPGPPRAARERGAAAHACPAPPPSPHRTGAENAAGRRGPRRDAPSLRHRGGSRGAEDEDAAGVAGLGRPRGRRRRRGGPGGGAGGPVLHAGAAAVPLGAALGAGASELRLSCRAAGGGAARSCAYRGEPRRCPAYSARSHQYWRQILSRLRRRLHPCAPGAPLSARLCGPGRAPPEAQLRLLPDPGPATPAPTPEPTEDPAETYCTERWHSLCSFFVGFWEG
ncbi:LOW QUALITY PROTEIN: fibroblast growth factor-binding protein 3 [Corapipo altera]|uniref:LOW QUALITY PROTEIN: fibroblast growth factor-binding protein 3 n=1 Tax=Corapipo altera TaxID=415028 RepID=UPI000FD6A832|nr:LOW QUALITY PROTEIN: fibroblast growth factor-binding protein 3 [Corapipo altera]